MPRHDLLKPPHASLHARRLQNASHALLIQQLIRPRKLLARVIKLRNECEALWLTDHSAPAAEINARPVVAVSARVHPGESNASWMMQGILDFLSGPTAEVRAIDFAVVLAKRAVQLLDNATA